MAEERINLEEFERYIVQTYGVEGEMAKALVTISMAVLGMALKINQRDKDDENRSRLQQATMASLSNQATPGGTPDSANNG